MGLIELKKKNHEESDKGCPPQEARYVDNDSDDKQEEQDEQEVPGDNDEQYGRKSIDSVERHPNSTHCYNYFPGDKRQKWAFGDSADGAEHWMTKDGTDISKIMYDYRYESYSAAKRMRSISSERILSLSFIFIVNSDNLEGFISNCKDKENAIRNGFKDTMKRPIPDDALIITNRIDNLRNNESQLNEYMAKLHRTYWDSSSEMTTYYNIINSYCRLVNPLTNSHTEQDHDSYEFFTKEIFHSNIYLKHKISKRLSASKDLIPDYKLAYEYKYKKVLDLFIIEVKKEKKLYTPDDNDKIKINLEMQIMLNELILLNVNQPVVHGLLIQGNLSMKQAFTL